MEKLLTFTTSNAGSVTPIRLGLLTFAAYSYAVNLREWFQGKNRNVGFSVPMIWREQTNHFNGFYFCQTNISGITSKTRSKIAYPNVSSATRSVPGSPNLPVLFLPSSEEDQLCLEETDSSSETKAFRHRVSSFKQGQRTSFGVTEI